MIVSALLWTLAGRAGAAEFIGLGDLPGGPFWSAPSDVSSDGSVVVGSSDSGSRFGQEAFRWTAETGMVGLGYLPGKDEFSTASSVSADGSVVVGDSQFGLVQQGGQRETFRWTADGGMVGIGDLLGGSFHSRAGAVSADGSVVVGRGSSSRFPFGEPFRWTEATGIVGLDLSGEARGISGDSSVVVGSRNSEAFRWTVDGGMVGLGHLPRRTSESYAYDVSADGSVVVGDSWGIGGNREREAFRWTATDGMIGLGLSRSFAWAVSADGSLVGGGSNVRDCIAGRSGCGEAFIWDETRGARNLKTLLIDEFGLADSLAGWELFWVKSISADGLTIVGDGTNPSGREEAWLAYLGGSPLQGGDANQDLEFDQLDLVQVQIAAKYLSGQAATWGEGDWNGAPGGSQGKPPVGDGLFDQLDIVAALSPAHYLTGPYALLHPNGQRGDSQTSVIYNAVTGELEVDSPAGIELTSINIDSAAGIFSGDSAQNLGGSFDNDADDNIFKATFGSSFGSLSFGNVAQSRLSQEFVLNDLTVIGSLAGGGDIGDVDLIYVPEPTSVVLMTVGFLAVLAHVRNVMQANSRQSSSVMARSYQ